MAKSFELAWTLNDENEFGVPVLPIYLTMQEMGLVILGCIFSYVAAAPVIGTGLANFAFMLVATLTLVSWMSKHKNGKPASWLWDLRLGFGLLPLGRGLIKGGKGVRWLSMHHVAQPSVFLTGETTVGEDLTMSAPWMQQLVPAVDWPPLIVPRRRRGYRRDPSPAPAWFRAANGFGRVVNPRIPLTVTWTLAADRDPPGGEAPR
ncbi:MAG TPA: hypothetical protein VEL07_22285 [Planctomycetota bacterium]|nr:hypothetical protein [Planctomycetota bacterium]